MKSRIVFVIAMLLLIGIVLGSFALGYIFFCMYYFA